MRRRWRWVSIAGKGFFVLTLGLLLLVLYWGLVQGVPPASITNVKTDRHIYAAGDFIELSLDYCKFVDRHALSEPTLIGPITVAYGPRLSSSVPVGCGQVVVSYQLPSHLVTGDYAISTVLTYKVNPLFTRHVHWLSPSFHVVASESNH